MPSGLFHNTNIKRLIAIACAKTETRTSSKRGGKEKLRSMLSWRLHFCRHSIPRRELFSSKCTHFQMRTFLWLQTRPQNQNLSSSKRPWLSHEAPSTWKGIVSPPRQKKSFKPRVHFWQHLDKNYQDITSTNNTTRSMPYHLQIVKKLSKLKSADESTGQNTRCIWLNRGRIPTNAIQWLTTIQE
jgi:hypothetical protein